MWILWFSKDPSRRYFHLVKWSKWKVTEISSPSKNTSPSFPSQPFQQSMLIALLLTCSNFNASNREHSWSDHASPLIATSRGDSITVSPGSVLFYSMLRDHYHHISAWLPTDHRNPVPTALPLSASWNGNKSKAVLPGSAWSGTHSSASQHLTAACPGQTPPCEEGKIPFLRGGMQAWEAGTLQSEPDTSSGDAGSVWEPTNGAELLRSSRTVAHLPLPSAHTACTGAVRLLNPLLAVGWEAGALLRGFPSPVLSNPSSLWEAPFPHQLGFSSVIWKRGLKEWQEADKPTTPHIPPPQKKKRSCRCERYKQNP